MTDNANGFEKQDALHSCRGNAGVFWGGVRSTPISNAQNDRQDALIILRWISCGHFFNFFFVQAALHPISEAGLVLRLPVYSGPPHMRCRFFLSRWRSGPRPSTTRTSCP